MVYSGSLPKDANVALYARVESRLHKGDEEQKKLIDRVSSTVIRDRLVSPLSMKFHGHNGKVELRYLTQGALVAEGFHAVHKLALTQLSQKVNLPMTYVSFLGQASPDHWRTELLAENFNMLYGNIKFPDKQENPRFLHRIVGTELRGFLSRRFNRNLASAPLLRAFLEATRKMGAVPFEALATDVKVSLKCFLPYIFEPLKDQPVCVGVEWSNSDFGLGKMQVCMTVWQPRADRFSVLDESISRVHLGSVIEESDIELSEDTYKKELEAQKSAIFDAVTQQLAPERVDRLMDAIKQASEEHIPWAKLKGQLTKYLNKKEVDILKMALEEGGISDLPPTYKDGEEIVATKWWAVSALSWLASKEEDAEKKMDLQHAAGALLEVKP